MPPIVSGAIDLLTDASNWLLALIPVGAGVMLGYHGLMKAMSDGDPAYVHARNQAMKNVLVGAAIAEGAMGLVRFILPYFAG